MAEGISEMMIFVVIPQHTGSHCPKPRSLKRAAASIDMSEHKEQEGFLISVLGAGRVAWFADAEQAEEWATANHFGNWLLNEYSIPIKPLFTPEQLQYAREKGDELAKFFEEHAGK